MSASQIDNAVVGLRGRKLGRAERRLLLRAAPYGSPEHDRWIAPSRQDSEVLHNLHRRGLLNTRRVPAPPGVDPFTWGRPNGAIRTALGEALVHVLEQRLREGGVIRWDRVSPRIEATLREIEATS